MVFSRSGLEALASSLSGRYAALYEAEPSEARTAFDDDVLTFSFRGGLRPLEAELLEQGRPAALRTSRERFLDVVGAQLAAPVEAFARSHVAFHVGLFEPEGPRTIVLFGFEEHEGAIDPSDPRRRVSWSAQIRRRTRQLCKEQAEVGEVHRDVVGFFREQRRECAMSYSRSSSCWT